MRPQAAIKVRKGAEQTANKIATLRQMSNEAGQRDRGSLGTEVAVIDNLEELTDHSVDTTIAAGTAFQRVLQIR